MRYLSVCSGIEAASVAWGPLGWEPVAFSEVDRFPSAVLAHHYPSVPNLGDMTAIRGEDYRGAIDVLVGGTPCQSFSVAGLRAGLDDDRGNLALRFVELARDARPRWVVWENVPGVLSSNGGRDFGAFLGALVECGYGWSYRVLDARYFGLAQRRARVFVVAHLGAWQPAAAVLLEWQSLRGDPAPSDQAGEDAAGASDAGAPGGCITGEIAHALTGEGHDASEDGTGRGTPITLAPPISRALSNVSGGNDPGANKGAPIVVGPLMHDGKAAGSATQQAAEAGHVVCEGFPDPAYTKARRAHTADDDETWVDGEVAPTMTPFDMGDVRATPIAFGGQMSVTQTDSDLSQTLQAKNPQDVAGGAAGRPRRLTPRECERLQGFPDDYTAIPYRGKPAADGPRYKALGNSMPVPVMRWIGERIHAVEGVME